MIKKICVIGAGTMGSGIAQSAAQSGFAVLLFDINPVVLENAKAAMNKSLQYLLDKGKINILEKEAIYKRIVFVNDINECRADIIVEAIVEKVEAKVSLFNTLAGFNLPNVIFATNTSSLSVSEIQTGVQDPQRVIGMHFFNLAQVL